MKLITKTTQNPKVVRVIKKFQTSYNAVTNKIVEQNKRDKAIKESFNFSIDLATMAMVAKDTNREEESQIFNKACNHLDPKL